MIWSARFCHSAILSVLLLSACSEPIPSPPHCRSSVILEQHEATGAGCVITASKQLLVIHHRLSGKFDIPAGGVNDNESLACAAHRETFEETGLNVAVIDFLGTTDSGLALFSCMPSGGLLPEKYPTLPVPDWATTEVDGIEWIDPFTLRHENWRYPDQLVEVRDAFVVASKQQK